MPVFVLWYTASIDRITQCLQAVRLVKPKRHSLSGESQRSHHIILNTAMTSAPLSSAPHTRSPSIIAVILLDIVLLGIVPLIGAGLLIHTMINDWQEPLPYAMFWVWFMPLALATFVGIVPAGIVAVAILITSIFAWRGGSVARLTLVTLVACSQLPAIGIGSMYIILHYAVRWSGQDDQVWVGFLYQPSRIVYGLVLLVVNV